MYGKDEKAYMALGAKFREEVAQIDKQVEALTARRIELMALLDGDILESDEGDLIDVPQGSSFIIPNSRIDEALVDAIKKNPGIKRAAIDEVFLGRNISPYQISRSLERCKRRGLIQVKGKSKAAVWTAVK
jgi:hypothetical protein